MAERPSRENFLVDDFIFKFYFSQIMSYLCQKCKKREKLGNSFVSEIKRMENCPDFDRLVQVIQHGLRGLIVKTTKGKSTEANNVSDILHKWVFWVNNSWCCHPFVGLNLERRI